MNFDDHGRDPFKFLPDGMCNRCRRHHILVYACHQVAQEGFYYRVSSARITTDSETNKPVVHDYEHAVRERINYG